MEVVIALLRNVACVAKSLLPEDHRLFRPFNHYPHSTNLDILIIVLQTGEKERWYLEDCTKALPAAQYSAFLALNVQLELLTTSSKALTISSGAA